MKHFDEDKFDWAAFWGGSLMVAYLIMLITLAFLMSGGNA